MRKAANDTSSASTRCLTRKEIERDYGMKPAVFSRMVAKGLMPTRLPGTRLWDSRAIDHALNKLSGLGPAVNDNETEADRWFREHGGEGSA